MGTLDEEQEQAFNLIVSGHNLLLTGQKGTGQSYVIKTAVKHLRSTGKTVALTCPTGIATSVFEDEHACTLHKWAGLEDGRSFFPHHINLEIIHRQSETLLVTSVNELECGTISENTVAFFNSLHRPLQDEHLGKAVHLFARNVDVDLFNYERIQKFHLNYMCISQMMKAVVIFTKILAPKYLGIKVGIPVMLLVNLSDDLVNGKVGTVTYIDNDSCTLTIQFCIKLLKRQ
ncbi:unnamed protein product [Mytilus edulis]|uniref:DNA helicase Pif1-like 2B domain-containing protein n=1 Tax=Mytilus edulis TaxID=6550 RepID=A0A8S3VJ14_MYTED|nr:unnamed protein product [Mytilus edulis]